MKLIVIGGGAAGFFAAIHAAQNGSDVILLEKSNKVLAKVKVSGGGRCNVTNVIMEPGLLIQNYPRGSRELLGAFTKFGSEQTINWFESNGVSLKAESDGRIFPVTNNSQTIIDCLNRVAVAEGVQIKLSTAVQKIVQKNPGFELILADGGIIEAEKIIIATGGSPQLKSYDWLHELGHSVVPPVPSLFTFNIPVNPMQDLMGLTVADCQVKIAGTKLDQRGPLLFTHWGISGPAILKLSAWAARTLADRNYQFEALLNFFPAMHEMQLREKIMILIKENGTRKILNTVIPELPSRLWNRICFLCDIPENQKWNEISKKTINNLIQQLGGLKLTVSGKTTFKEEFVTCGGIKLNEIDMKTMESKKVAGLYFAGEVLDIDAVTGGFNFQAAWTTGYISGISASNKKSTVSGQQSPVPDDR